MESPAKIAVAKKGLTKQFSDPPDILLRADECRTF